VVYANFEYYKGAYCGEMAEKDYDRLSRQASAYLDFITYDRIKKVTDETIMEKVKDACCAVADTLLLNEQGGGIAAETNDGVSVTYVNGTGSKTDEQRLYGTALIYLGHTGLMYRGVD
jgi:hypothetical protein